MRILKKWTLKQFREKHPDSELALRHRYKEVNTHDREWPSDVTKQFSRASTLPNNRIVFRIKWNDYRLVVRVDYSFRLVFIRFIGTHAEYDKIDAATI